MAKHDHDNLYSYEHQRRVQYDQRLKDEQFFRDKARYEEKRDRERRLSELPQSELTPAKRIIMFCTGAAIITFFIFFMKSPDFRDWVQSIFTYIWEKIVSIFKWFYTDI